MTGEAARKFVNGPAAVAVIVQVPVAVNVTTPPDSVHTPEAAIDGVNPVDEPVTADTEDTTGVYVPFGNGEAGTDDVNANVCAAFAIEIVCVNDVVWL